MQRKRQREDGATSPGLCQPQELGEGPDTGCPSEPPGGPSPWHLGLCSHLQQPWEAQASPKHSRTPSHSEHPGRDSSPEPGSQESPEKSVCPKRQRRDFAQGGRWDGHSLCVFIPKLFSQCAGSTSVTENDGGRSPRRNKDAI